MLSSPTLIVNSRFVISEASEGDASIVRVTVVDSPPGRLKDDLLGVIVIPSSLIELIVPLTGIPWFGLEAALFGGIPRPFVD
jgi:hypothetical protein